MSLAPFNARVNLPATFESEELTTLYRDLYTSVTDSFRSNPALGVIHHMVAERLVFVYVKSIEVGQDPTAEGHVLRSFLDQFTKLFTELGKETRVQSREGVFKQALIAAVVLVLQEELDSYPQLANRIMQRLEGL